MVGLILTILHLSSNYKVTTANEAFLSLSSEIGKQITVSRDLGRRFVCIERNGKPASVAMSALASCLHASIVEDGAGLEIVRTKADIQSTKDHIVAERTKWLESAFSRIEQERKRVRGSGLPGNATDSVLSEFLRQERLRSDSFANQTPPPDLTPLRDLLPSAGLLLDIAKRLGGKRIAEESLQETTVFEDQPVLSNEALPTHSDLDTRYETAMSSFVATNLPPQATTPSSIWNAEMAPYTLGWGKGLKEIKRLRLAELCPGTEITLMLTGYDVDGNLVVYTDFHAGPTDLVKTRSIVNERGGQPRENTDWYALTSDGLAAASFASQSTAQDFPDWFLNPDKIEPLNLFVPTALEALASENLDQCVAFEVTDSFWTLVQRCIRTDRISLTTLKQTMQRSVPFEKQRTSDFVSWRPVDPFSAEALQADRHELAQFAKDAWKQRNVGLRSVGRLYRYGSQRPGLLTNTWEFDARSGLNEWSTPGKNLTDRTYRLIGAISDVDWKELMAGSAISAEKLNVVEELKDVVSQEFGLIPEGRSMFPDIYRHPAELYQEAQLSKTLISLQSLGSALIQDWPVPDGYVLWAPVVPSDGTPALFNHLGISFKNGTPEVASSRDQYEASLSTRKFRTGHADDMKVMVGLPRNLWFEILSKGGGVADTDPMSYSDLPKELRDLIWQSLYEDALERINDILNPVRTAKDTAVHAIPPP